MNIADFNKAIAIITKAHSSVISINHVETNGQVSPVLASPTIHIKDCNTSVINNLVEAGFSLNMSELGLSVTKI